MRLNITSKLLIAALILLIGFGVVSGQFSFGSGQTASSGISLPKYRVSCQTSLINPVFGMVHLDKQATTCTAIKETLSLCSIFPQSIFKDEGKIIMEIDGNIDSSSYSIYEGITALTTTNEQKITLSLGCIASGSKQIKFTVFDDEQNIIDSHDYLLNIGGQ